MSVRPSWTEEELTTEADALGVFRIPLPSASLAGPHELEVRAGEAARTLGDLHFGEVWLCAGQSNMEMTLSGVVPPGKQMAEADLPGVRLFDVENAFASAPEDECRGRWRVCTPRSAPEFSAVALFFGRRLAQELDCPIGLVTADWGGTIGEAWASAEALRSFEECAEWLERLEELRGSPVENPPTWLHPNRPGVLYNGMIAPLAPDPERALSLRGVIWYHGEANRGRAKRYGELSVALISDWRRAFGIPEMPFYFVQIAPFAYPRDGGEAARLRDEQRRTLAVPGTGMAVTMDVGDPARLHPTRKLEVGERLAGWALARTYGQRDRAFSGPLFRGWVREGRSMRLSFEHAEGLRTGGEELEHFTLAGPDGVLHPARARIEGETILVWSEEVEDPCEVRFGGGASDLTDLVNAAGLPAASFIGDARDRL